MKKKTPKKQQASTVKADTAPPLTPLQHKQAFKKAMAEKQANPDLVEKVVYVADMHLAAGRPFQESNIIQAMSQFDVSDSLEQVQEIFRAYALALINKNRLSVIIGVYDSGEILLPI